ALDAEDSLALTGRRPRPLGSGATTISTTIDVAAINLPRISNFTDLDALAIEPGVGVRLVDDAAALGDPDLVILPGSKSTVSDLDWLRGRGLDRAIERCDGIVLGSCGRYQMTG